jgi:hypothetical protein
MRIESTQPVRIFAAAAVFLLNCVCVTIARAGAFTPGNVVVTSQQQLIEYTPSGAVVQTVNVPTGGGDGGCRDLMVDKNGNMQIYNGTFSPVLTQYNPVTNTFAHQTGVFSTVNNLSYGGLYAWGNYVFVTDMNTNGSPGAGLVRYNLDGGTPTVFGSGLNYIDVTVGRDGTLYGLRDTGINGGGFDVDKFNPTTGSSLGSVHMGNEFRAMAVDGNGDFYTVDFFNGIIHYNSSGQVVKMLTDTVGGLCDIDMDANGNLVMASHSGAVVFTTTALTGETGFNHRNTTALNFVTWADSSLAVPEPSTGLTVIAACVVCGLRRRAA